MGVRPRSVRPQGRQRPHLLRSLERCRRNPEDRPALKKFEERAAARVRITGGCAEAECGRNPFHSSVQKQVVRAVAENPTSIPRTIPVVRSVPRPRDDMFAVAIGQTAANSDRYLATPPERATAPIRSSSTMNASLGTECSYRIPFPLAGTNPNRW